MPQILWDEQSQWQDWTLTNLVATADGYLQIADGQSSGEAVSPVMYAANWQHWSAIVARGNRPVGTCMYLYFRSGATEAECEAAEWQGPIDTWSTDGELVFDLRTYLLSNSSIPQGPYIQIKLVLEAE